MMTVRYRLLESTAPATAQQGGSFQLTLKMTNDGFARIHNPRLLEVVLHRDDGSQFRVKADQGLGNRMWLPGPGETKTLEIATSIPATAKPGAYELILNLPDPYPSLHDRPEYSIRLANRGTWEASTGFNRLRQTIKIGQ